MVCVVEADPDIGRRGPSHSNRRDQRRCKESARKDYPFHLITRVLFYVATLARDG